MDITTFKHSRQKELSFAPEDLRWATPEIVAKYRAKRLSEQGRIIIEVGCGVGFQTLALAEKFEKVYAVEIDKDKIERAANNAKALGLKNIQFIQADALSDEVVKKVKDAEVIFCDPERLPSEEERTLEKITPDLKRLVNLYSSITQNIAIELPPQIKNISLGGEREYLSLQGKLNRLTLYFGKLAKAERSAVILPSEAKLESKREESKVKLKKTLKWGKFLFEVDPAVVKAGLLSELGELTKTALFSESKLVYFTSKELVLSPFFSHSFRVLGGCQFKEAEIINLLKTHGAGKVTLRFSIDPKEYWQIRSSYEKNLSGEKKLSLFKFEEIALVGEEIKPTEEIKLIL